MHSHVLSRFLSTLVVKRRNKRLQRKRKQTNSVSRVHRLINSDIYHLIIICVATMMCSCFNPLNSRISRLYHEWSVSQFVLNRGLMAAQIRLRHTDNHDMSSNCNTSFYQSRYIARFSLFFEWRSQIPIVEDYPWFLEENRLFTCKHQYQWHSDFYFWQRDCDLPKWIFWMCSDEKQNNW
jgi:hypothetical protein